MVVALFSARLSAKHDEAFFAARFGIATFTVSVGRLRRAGMDTVSWAKWNGDQRGKNNSK
jgi:hypothetical protein